MQTPYAHANEGHGCKYCAAKDKNKKYETVDFKNISSTIHNNKYDYSKSIYKNAYSKLIIICPKHGEFNQVAGKHMRGEGCKKCSSESRILTNDQYLKKIKDVHGDTYDYSMVKYIHSSCKVEIICKRHGSFFQQASSHQSGRGCKKCGKEKIIAKTRFSVSKPESKWLDMVNVPNTTENRQVNIIAGNYDFTVDGYIKETNTVYEFYGDYYHGNPKRFSPNGYNKSCKTTFGELYNKTILKENVLKESGYNVVSIWEHDYNLIIKNKK